MHSPKQKLGSPIHTGSIVVLKGGVGMQDRLLHEKQRMADEAITIDKNQKEMDKYQQAHNNQGAKGTLSTDSRNTKDDSMDHIRPDMSRDGDVQPSIGPIPFGFPLAKPPVLPSLAQGSLHDSGSSHFGSTGQLGHDELMTDDESAADKSTICDSKIYEIGDPYKQRQGLHQLANYKSMNPDEMIFLEAACALSRVGTDIGHVSETRFEPSRLPPLERPCTMRSNSSRSQVSTSTTSSIGTIESDRKLMSGSKKRQPLGPPPYMLRKIRKTILP